VFRNEVIQAIRAFADAFAKQPFNYLFEADVQADLHARLRTTLDTLHVDLGTVRDHGRLGMKDPMVSRVHAEYPTGIKFDLAIVSGCDAEKRIWNQPVGAAIEIKLWQADGSGGGINGDLWKLHQHSATSGTEKFLGVAMVAGHPKIGSQGKGALQIGNFTGTERQLQSIREEDVTDVGIYVCIVDTRAAESGDPIHWWRSDRAPDTEQG
jgi:hypothetical protein